MTERERLLAVLEGRAPDKTPWYGDLSWWHYQRQKDGTLPAAYRTPDGCMKLHQDAGVGIYLYPPFAWTEEYDSTVSQTPTTDGGRTVTVLSTPVGELRSVLQELPESRTIAYVERFVKTPADLAVMRYAFTHRRFAANYPALVDCDRWWGPWGLPCVLGPICTTAMQSLLSRWAGVETTVHLFADAREELEITLAAVQESDDEIFSILCGSPCALVILPENLSGEVTGRTFIRQYELPYWRKRLAQLHDAGKCVGIHNDGTLRASLPLLVEAGFDYVEAVTPAPVGDMTVQGIRQATQGKLIVWGGLPGALFSPLYKEDYFVEFVKEVLRAFRPGSGFVLGSADQVPPDAEFDRIRLVRELVERHG